MCMKISIKHIVVKPGRCYTRIIRENSRGRDILIHDHQMQTEFTFSYLPYILSSNSDKSDDKFSSGF